MEREYASEILACMPRDRTRYHYYRDYYALQLLGYVSGDGVPIDRLRRGRYARLLSKAPVRSLLAACGDGLLNSERLSAHWEPASVPFLLTLGLWCGPRWAWNQTSRPGYNLVLRLNFTRDHDRRFRRLFAPYRGEDTLNPYDMHPLLRRNDRAYFRETLAWARLDVDLENDEALIEEIQTDWVREAADARRSLPPCVGCEYRGRKSQCRPAAAARRYLDEVLAPYCAVWDEAMLSAVLFFLREEMGIRRIWYHTWASGNALKGIGGRWSPPRSLYSRLPRQFCFAETDDAPQLLHNRHTRRRLRKANVDPSFYQLTLH